VYRSSIVLQGFSRHDTLVLSQSELSMFDAGHVRRVFEPSRARTIAMLTHLNLETAEPNGSTAFSSPQRYL